MARGYGLNVLVTTDGSERSLQALPHAARLARAADAELHLVRILDKRMDLGDELDPSLSSAADTVAGRWQEEMERICESLDAESSCGVEVKGRKEQVHDAILRVASESEAGAIVMGTRGSGAIRRALLGSVAMSVLGHATIPVIVAGHDIAPPRESESYHLILTSDGSEASEAVIPAAAALFEEAKRRAVRFTLLQVNGSSGDERSDEAAEVNVAWQLSQLRKRLPTRFDVRTEVRTIPALAGVDSAILAAVDELEGDAVWMASHGHSLRRHLLAGSTALGVVSRATVPVGLVNLPPERKKK